MSEDTYSKKTPFLAKRSESSFVFGGQSLDNHGNVRIVMDKKTERFLIEKISNPDRFTNGIECKIEKQKTERQRAENEAECLMMLQGIEGVQKLEQLPFYQFSRLGDTKDATFHIPCKFINGIPLAKYVGNIELEQRIKIIHDIAATLREVHKKGIIHKDITPYNIIVNHERAYLIDFGLSRIINKTYTEKLDKLLRENCSPDYGAPEQKRGKRTTFASDVYSLGRVLQFTLNATENKKFGIIEYGAPYAKEELLLYALSEQATKKDPNSRPTIDGFISVIESWQNDKKPLAR